jgi:hypothetical protein
MTTEDDKPRRIYETVDLEVSHTSDLHTRVFQAPGFQVFCLVVRST